MIEMQCLTGSLTTVFCYLQEENIKMEITHFKKSVVKHVSEVIRHNENYSKAH